MKTLNFDAGTEGQILGAGATSATLGDQATITVTGSPVGTIKASAAARGARGLNVVVTTATDVYTVPYTDTANASARLGIFFRADSSRRPGTVAQVLARIRSASANAIILVLGTTGICILQNALGNSVKNLNGGAALPDGWYWASLGVTKGTGAGDGTLRLWLRNATTGALVDSYDASNVNAGTADLTTGQTGKPISSGTVNWDFDHFMFETGSNAEIPMPALNVAPTANAGTDQTVDAGASFTLTGTDSDSDGAIASRAWKLSGSTVSTSATYNGTAPITLAGQVLTYTYEVTDDDGATGSDTMTVTALPAATRLHDGTSVKAAISRLS